MRGSLAWCSATEARELMGTYCGTHYRSVEERHALEFRCESSRYSLARR